jgi:DNA topoisomerase-1
MLDQKWHKKKQHIENLANNLQSLRTNITKDLSSEKEKDRLTALVVSIMDKTGERVGNDESASNGHFGITGLKKRHVKIIGNTVSLDYVGKSGVKHEKTFTDEKIARNLKRAIQNTPTDSVFMTSDGFKISNDRINRYLLEYDITAKDIRGYSANKWLISGLKNKDIPKDEKERKKLFSKTLKSVAEKIGHGKATLSNHYIIPQLESKYVDKGKLIDLANRSTYELGGVINSFVYEIGGL